MAATRAKLRGFVAASVMHRAVHRGPVATCVGIGQRVFGRHEAIRSCGEVNGLIGRLSDKVCHPSTLRIVIWPEASSAQNIIAAVSAQGSTVWVLIRRLNSSCNRSIAFEVRIDFHWLGGKRVKVKSLSPASLRPGRRPTAAAAERTASRTISSSLECVAPSTSTISRASKQAKSAMKAARMTWRRNRKPATWLRPRPCQRRRSARVALRLSDRARGVNDLGMARPPTPARPHKGGGGALSAPALATRQSGHRAPAASARTRSLVASRRPNRFMPRHADLAGSLC